VYRLVVYKEGVGKGYTVWERDVWERGVWERGVWERGVWERGIVITSL